MNTHAQHACDIWGAESPLGAGRATLELTDRSCTDYIDRVEVCRRVAGHIRVAFEVADSTAVTRALRDAGAEVLAEPTLTRGIRSMPGWLPRPICS
jgi:lactoylglutathione lyase